MTDEKKKAFKDILTRAGKTFIQSFISYIGIDSLLGVTDFDALKRIATSLLIGACAAGISAVWNAAREWLLVRIDETESEGEANG